MFLFLLGKLIIKQRKRYARVSIELPPLAKSLLFFNCSFSFNELLNKEAQCVGSALALQVSGEKEKINTLN